MHPDHVHIFHTIHSSNFPRQILIFFNLRQFFVMCPWLWSLEIAISTYNIYKFVATFLSKMPFFYNPSGPNFHTLLQKNTHFVTFCHTFYTKVTLTLVLRACSYSAQIRASILTFNSDVLSQIQVFSASLVFSISLRIIIIINITITIIKDRCMEKRK